MEFANADWRVSRETCAAARVCDICHSERDRARAVRSDCDSRRAATITQADVARAIRAAKQAGAESVELRPDGTIAVLLKKRDADSKELVDREIIL